MGLQSFGGEGLDGAEEMFVFTQLAATFSHYVFPNFDQPDLKAQWGLTVVCPSEWEVVSNERSVREEEVSQI